MERKSSIEGMMTVTAISTAKFEVYGHHHHTFKTVERNS
jgi:hypothetical protein